MRGLSDDSRGLPEQQLALFLGAGGPQAVQIYYDKVGNYDGALYVVGGLWVLAAVLVLLVRKPKPPQRLLDEQAAAAATG